MKNLSITLLMYMAATYACVAQRPHDDTVAIMILDHMTDIIGDLTSCSFTVNTRMDAIDTDDGFVSHFAESKVYFDGPDKMQVHTQGDKGHRGFWYNGTLLYYYSFDENNYAVIDAPPTTIETIDTVHERYGVDFPAADFFYPTFTDDLMDNSDSITFLGTTIINHQECFRIKSSSRDLNIQIWIANDAMTLPVKYLISRNKGGYNLQYEGTFSDWQINPGLPASMFEFLPPPQAAKIAILAK